MSSLTRAGSTTGRRVARLVFVAAPILGLSLMAGCGGGGGGGNSVAPAPTAPASGPEYTATDLGTLGGDSSAALGLNDAGHAVGWTHLPAVAADRAFLFPGQAMQDIGSLGGSEAIAWAINALGDVVGGSNMPGDVARHAFRYNGAMQDLGTLGGANSVATDINGAGQVTGWSEIDAAGTRHAFLYDGDEMRDLGTLGGPCSQAEAINDAGVVVGYSENAQGHERGCIADEHGMRDVGLLWGDVRCQIFDINASGRMVGWSGDDDYHLANAFLHTGSSRLNLSRLGGNRARAYAINDDGLIVGVSDIPGGGQHGFVYEGDRMYDLNDLLDNASSGWEIMVARDVNNHGQIAATGRAQNGDQHALLLSPR